MNFSSLLTKISISILICLGLAVPAFALDTTTPAVTKKDLLQERQENRKELAQTKQAAIQNLKAQAATREAALKLKLQAFRDQKKAAVAERVSTNLNNINTKRTDQMLKLLTTMTNILNRLETRVNSSSPDVKDPAAARAAIASARESIASAQAAVNAQQDKDYTLTISTETKAKTEAQATRDALHSNLKSVRDQVIATKKAVSNAIRIAKGMKAEVEASSSGQ